MAFINMPDWVGKNLDLYQLVEIDTNITKDIKLKWKGNLDAEQVGATLTQSVWNELQKGIPQLVLNTTYSNGVYTATLVGLSVKNGSGLIGALDLYEGLEIKLLIDLTNDVNNPILKLNGYELEMKKVTRNNGFENISSNELVEGMVYNFIYAKVPEGYAMVCRELSLINVQGFDSVISQINKKVESLKTDALNVVRGGFDSFKQEVNTEIRKAYEKEILEGYENWKNGKELKINKLMKEANTTLKELENKKETLDTSIESLKSKYEEEQNKLEQSINQQITSFNSEFSTLQKQITTQATQQYNNLEGKLETLKGNTERELQNLKNNTEEIINNASIEYERLKTSTIATATNAGIITENRVREIAPVPPKATEDIYGTVTLGQIKSYVDENELNTSLLSIEEYVDLICEEKKDLIDFDILEIMKSSLSIDEKIKKLNIIFTFEDESSIDKILKDEECINFILENYFDSFLGFYLTSEEITNIVYKYDYFKYKFTKSTHNNENKIKIVKQTLEFYNNYISKREGWFTQRQNDYNGKLIDQMSKKLITEIVITKNKYDDSEYEVGYGKYKIKDNINSSHNLWCIGLKGVTFNRLDSNRWSYAILNYTENNANTNITVTREGDDYFYEVHN